MSVAETGRDAWMEERKRIRAVQKEGLAANDEAGRRMALSLYAVKSLLPVWRAWGLVIEASITPPCQRETRYSEVTIDKMRPCAK